MPYTRPNPDFLSNLNINKDIAAKFLIGLFSFQQYIVTFQELLEKPAATKKYTSKRSVIQNIANSKYYVSVLITVHIS